MKKIVQAGIFLVLAAVCLGLVYRVLAWKDTTGDYLSSVEQLQATDRDLMDLVFLGSSHVYCAVNPDLFWQREGVAAFDMAVSGMDRVAALHYLRELYNTQSPRVVCVEIYQLLFDRHAVQSNEYRNYLSLPLSPNAVEAVLEYGPQDPAAYLTRWPVVHTRYRELTAFDFVPYAPGTFGRGFFYSNGVRPVDWRPGGTAGTLPLSEENCRWLQQMADLCADQGSHMVGLVLPMMLSDEQQQTLNAAADYLAGLGVPVLDLNTQGAGLGLDTGTDFLDDAHLNTAGAAKVSAWLSDRLTADYDLPDRRGDDRYTLWEQNHWYDVHQQRRALLDAADKTDRNATLQAAADCPGLTVVVTLPPDCDRQDTRWQELLLQMGAAAEQIDAGGQWVFRTGADPCYRPADGAAVSLDLDAVHTLTLGADAGQPVQLDGAPCPVSGEKFSLVLYDDYECRLLCTLEY